MMEQVALQWEDDEERFRKLQLSDLAAFNERIDALTVRTHHHSAPPHHTTLAYIHAHTRRPDGELEHLAAHARTILFVLFYFVSLI